MAAKPELPEDVRKVMVSQPGPACSMLVVNGLAAVVVKTALPDIESFRGPVPILYQYGLGRYPEGAAIRLYLEIRDKPESPYRLEAFLNPGSKHDLPLLNLLTGQNVLDLHFFDMQARYVYSKRVRHRELNRRELTDLVNMALDWLGDIPETKRDWQAVKSQYQADMPL